MLISQYPYLTDKTFLKEMDLSKNGKSNGIFYSDEEYVITSDLAPQADKNYYVQINENGEKIKKQY